MCHVLCRAAFVPPLPGFFGSVEEVCASAENQHQDEELVRGYNVTQPGKDGNNPAHHGREDANKNITNELKNERAGRLRP